MPSDGSNTGVIVFVDNVPDWWDVGAYVSVAGPSSVWKPNGSASTYRAIWAASSVQDMNAAESGVYLGSGTISGAVTLYDMAASSAQVTLYSTCGRTETHTIQRGAGNIGTWNYSWSGVPTLFEYQGTGYEAYYLISAQCDGYKTRTYTGVTPSTTTPPSPKNLYLTPLRKITLRTQDNRTSIDPCSPSSSTLGITATVVDDNHNPIVYSSPNPPPGSTVRFTTTAGSFNANTLQQSINANTNSSGVAAVTLYGMRWSGTATVTATDDLTTPEFPNTTDDTYRCDWEQLLDQYGQPVGVSISDPSVTISPNPSPTAINRCGTASSTITADVSVCGIAPPVGTQVEFTIPADDPAVFVGDGKTVTVGTTAYSSYYGRATVQVTADSLHHFGLATINARLPDYAGGYTNSATVTVLEHEYNLQIAPDPTEITGTGTSTITFTATNALTGGYYNGLVLTIHTTSGDFGSGQTTVTRTTSGYGTATVTLNMSSAPSAYVSASYTDGCNGTVYVGTVVVYRQLPWNNISVGVNYSSILADDLIPGDGKEVAVIVATSLDPNQERQADGKMYVWNSTGTLAWTSKDAAGNDLPIDTSGDNTLSAADLDGRGGLEITAPVLGTGAVYAFGYDTGASTFRPLAGWPALTYQFTFHQVAAATGDANLDGSMEVVAGDESCFVYSWNPTGNWSNSESSHLWRQITYSASTNIVASSVALGDVNSFADSARMPDALVGAYLSSAGMRRLYAFPGDEWGAIPPESPSYPAQWPPRDTSNDIHSSPAIGDIDGDGENDVAIGDDSGKLYMWLSSTNAWVGRQLAANTDSHRQINSSAAIVSLNSQRCVVVGCNNGRVYAVKSDGTPITGWPAGGILLNSNPGSYSNQARTSPVVGDVMNTGSPQIVVGSADGNVYVVWSDGYNHSGGPVAKAWTCALDFGIEVNSTPAICSLNGTTVSLIVGSNDGIYKFDLYSGTFVANSSRWPWPTFHRDNARTGCTTTPASPVSASVAGKVTLSGNPVPGARISIRTTGGQPVAVYGRSGATRTDRVLAVGDSTLNNEINEGGYCISQLPPNTTYQITATDQNGNHQWQQNVSMTSGRLPLDISLP